MLLPLSLIVVVVCSYDIGSTVGRHSLKHLYSYNNMTI